MQHMMYVRDASGLWRLQSISEGTDGRSPSVTDFESSDQNEESEDLHEDSEDLQGAIVRDTYPPVNTCQASSIGVVDCSVRWSLIMPLSTTPNRYTPSWARDVMTNLGRLIHQSMYLLRNSLLT